MPGTNRFDRDKVLNLVENLGLSRTGYGIKTAILKGLLGTDKSLGDSTLNRVAEGKAVAENTQDVVIFALRRLILSTDRGGTTASQVRTRLDLFKDAPEAAGVIPEPKKKRLVLEKLYHGNVWEQWRAVEVLVPTIRDLYAISSSASLLSASHNLEIAKAAAVLNDSFQPLMPSGDSIQHRIRIYRIAQKSLAFAADGCGVAVTQVDAAIKHATPIDGRGEHCKGSTAWANPQTQQDRHGVLMAKIKTRSQS